LYNICVSLINQQVHIIVMSNLSKSRELELRDLLISKVKSGEIICPIGKNDCINCKYLRVCASKLEEE